MWTTSLRLKTIWLSPLLNSPLNRAGALSVPCVQRHAEGSSARQVVADLFDLLARGGSVSVHIEELGGRELG
jgi:hypothetical protein